MVVRAVRAAMVSVVSCAAVLLLAGSTARAAAPPPVCDLWASTTGRDEGRGTKADPFRSAQRIVDRLRPGQTGCLLRGTFVGHVSITRGGVRGRPVTLRSAPGNRATLRGRLSISDAANDVVIAYLRLDGSIAGGDPSPQVNGDRVVFRGNDVTNAHTGICFILGGAFDRFGRAVGTVIDRNRIHDCGRLPATNHDHGVYVEAARDTRVTNNVIYGNADWGVHLYPDADRTYVAHNVIVGNGGGVIVAGEAGGEEYAVGLASDAALIERNVIANSLLYHNVDTYWGGPTGRGNVARKNCIWKGRKGNFGQLDGLAARENVVANPLFVNPGQHDFALRTASPCRRVGAGPTR